MRACQLLQSVEAVVNENAARVGGILFLVHHGIGAALFKGGKGEAVAIERRAFEREEQRALGTVAAVGGDGGVLGENLVKFGYFHNTNGYYVRKGKKKYIHGQHAALFFERLAAVPVYVFFRLLACLSALTNDRIRLELVGDVEKIVEVGVDIPHISKFDLIRKYHK